MALPRILLTSDLSDKLHVIAAMSGQPLTGVIRAVMAAGLRHHTITVDTTDIWPTADALTTPPSPV